MGGSAALYAMAGTAAYSAREGHIARKDASAEKEVQAAKQKKLEDERAATEKAEKDKLSREKFRRMSSGGYEGTVLAGLTGSANDGGRATLLGSVGR